MLTNSQLLGIGIGIATGALVYWAGALWRRPALKRIGRLVMLLSLFALPLITVLNVYYASQVDPSKMVRMARSGRSISFAESPLGFAGLAIASITTSFGIFLIALLWGVHLTRAWYLRAAWWTWLGVLGVVSLGVLMRVGWQTPWVAGVGAALIAPALLQRLLYRDFHAARRATQQGRHDDAVALLQRFLGRVYTRPWLWAAFWLRWSYDTSRVDALASNELGAAYLAQGDPAAAERAWRAALELDPGYAIPYVNLARLAESRGDVRAAWALLQTAERYGYPRPEAA